MAIGEGLTIEAADIQAIKDNVDAFASASTSTVSTSQTTSSTSYTDLSTSGPAVTLTTGTMVLLVVYSRLSNDTAGQVTVVSVAVSGASTVAADDARAIAATSAATDQAYRIGSPFLLTGLTAGSNTFTLKYRVDGGTGKFRDRHLAVIPIGA